MRSGVQPCGAATEFLNLQPTCFEVATIQASDFQLAARGRFESARLLDDIVTVKLEAWNGEVAFRLCRFFL